MFFNSKKDPNAGKSKEQIAAEEQAAAAKRLAAQKKQKVEDEEAFQKDPNHVFSNNYTMLERAINKRDIDEIKRVLAAGADPNFIGKTEESPLRRAVTGRGSHNLEMTEILLDAGADPNYLEETKRTPILTSAICGNVNNADEMVELLLKKGASANQCTDGDTSHSSVFQAYNHGGKRFELVLKYGGDVFAKPNGTGPLYRSVLYNENFEKVRMLVKYSDQKLRLLKAFNKYAIKASGENSNTHLYINDIFWDEAVKSPSAYKNPVGGQSFFHDMVEQKKHDKVSAVLAHNAYQDSQNHMGQTPLHVAAKMNDARLIALFIKHGADVNKQDEIGFTPMDVLVENDGLGGISEQLLRESGADFNRLSAPSGKAANGNIVAAKPVAPIKPLGASK